MLVFLSPTRSRSPISYNSKPCARLQVKNTCNGGKLRNNPNSQSQIPNSIFPPLTFLHNMLFKRELPPPNHSRLLTTFNRIPPQPQRRANPLFCGADRTKGGAFFWYFSFRCRKEKYARAGQVIRISFNTYPCI